ncbi:DUF1573 domain-containing protein [Ruficoccus sp. ZRK36]|uniref:DUF1573 domain-containing protein n=1 Tax=Ruficoccus sp. ZRK36 TaxID=2866311 RepID=UPI001C73CE32|nr:DUF1573 domain-containing protein [Ruficoccus sp. ZRK36]QYY35732.1 DUF1573 domain-containing protein [Ruficoccus sp. ZRK36]
MKAIAYLLALCTALPLSAELEWETMSLTVPASFGQESLEATYPFKNTGSTPVEILEVKTSCGCTYAAASRTMVAPGESAEIAAFFETEDREGPQHSTITVLTDEKDHPATVLNFRSDIPVAANLPTRVVKWRASDTAETKSLDIPVEPGVSLTLQTPKRPLPVSAVLEKKQDGDQRSYHLSLTPLGGETGSGILPIEANWGSGQSRVYNIYVRVAQ